MQSQQQDQSDHSDKDKLDDLDQMLSPNLDMDREIADVDLMLTRGLEQIDSKTVEDIFKGVLSTDQAPSSSPSASKCNRIRYKRCLKVVYSEPKRTRKRPCFPRWFSRKFNVLFIKDSEKDQRKFWRSLSLIVKAPLVCITNLFLLCKNF